MDTQLDNREWVRQAICEIEADYKRSSDTHLLKVAVPGFQYVDLYFKDESTHPTGSLKHRLARSLFLYGLCNGSINEGTTIIEASSGSTAISEAYFAKLIGLDFVAVVPENTAEEKLEKIAFYGGTFHKVPPSDLYRAAEDLAMKLGGVYMDQFTFAERATDWRGNNNIAQSIFDQMRYEKNSEPAWVVVSAGTGGTSATIGRYIRYRGLSTRLCVADPEGSVFYEAFMHRDYSVTSTKPSIIEGIGRPRVEPSFVPAVIDRMIKVPDAASLACIHWLQSLLDRRCGGSTGCNMYAALEIMCELEARKAPASVVSVLCDGGERYANSYYSERWLREKGLHLEPYTEQLNTLMKKPVWSRPETDEASTN